MKDYDIVLQRLSELERMVNMTQVRFGTVHETKAGKINVNMGKRSSDKGEQGSSGQQSGQSQGQSSESQQEEKPWLSGWVQTAHQHGWLNENVPYEKGQNVAIMTMDGEFRQALVFPYTYSDNNDLPKDAATDKHTYRIRKPKEEQQSQTGSSSGQQNSSSQNEQKKEDKDEEDFIFRNDYEGRYRRKKKAKHLFGEPAKDKQSSSSGTQQSGSQTTGSQQSTQQQNETKGSGEKGEQHWLSVGDASITVVEGKIRFKVGSNTWIMDKYGVHQGIKGESDQQSGTTQQTQTPKTIDEDKQDTDGKFTHTLLKDKRVVKADDGQTHNTIENNKVTQKAEDQTWTWKKDSTLEGGTLKHDGKKIDKSHKHGQVQSGGSKTGDPEEE